jgi:hypothetical protein
MTRREALGAGLLLGTLAGLWDGIAVVLENPRSFPDAGSVATFVGATLALSIVVGGLVGGALAALPRRPGPWIVAAGLGLGVFLWAGVRVHVRWFFGEPLTAPRYALANLALSAAALVLAFVVHRVLRGAICRALAGGRLPAMSVGLFVLGVAAASLGRAPSGGRDKNQPAPDGAREVLLVTLDTTRADHLSVYGYPRGTTPNLDRLARTGRLWPIAYAPIPLTNPSHSSIFTGLLPREHGVRNNGTALADARTFVPDLAADGWHCSAFVSGIPLKAGLSGLSAGFAVYDDRFSWLEGVHPMLTTLALVRVANRVLPLDFIERRATLTVRAAGAGLAASAAPRFGWVHLFDPHTPYDAPRPLQRRFARESAGWTAHGVDVCSWPIADYDAEIRETDRRFGQLVQAWDEVTGGRGLVVVTADHGEGLEQHGELAHGTQLFEEDLRVPLIVRGSRAGIAPRPVSTTILHDWIPAWARGEAPAEGTGPVTFLLETFAPEGRQDQSAVVDPESRKILVNWATGEEASFDLAADPGETRALDPPPAWADLQEGLSPATAEVDALDPEVVRRLRALGYLH